MADREPCNRLANAAPERTPAPTRTSETIERYEGGCGLSRGYVVYREADSADQPAGRRTGGGCGWRSTRQRWELCLRRPGEHGGQRERRLDPEDAHDAVEALPMQRT